MSLVNYLFEIDGILGRLGCRSGFDLTLKQEDVHKLYHHVVNSEQGELSYHALGGSLIACFLYSPFGGVIRIKSEEEN